MSDFQEGDKVVIETEVTAVNPDWLAVRLTFGRMVQNIRVSRDMVRLAEEPAPAECPEPPPAPPAKPARKAKKPA